MPEGQGPSPRREGNCRMWRLRLNRKNRRGVTQYRVPDLPPWDTIGVATMDEHGTITLQLRAEGPGGMRGDALLQYSPVHPQYHEILAHLGELRPGESKWVPPWPETREARIGNCLCSRVGTLYQRRGAAPPSYPHPACLARRTAWAWSTTSNLPNCQGRF
jgi:hypothetical protein